MRAPSKQPTNYFCKTLTASDTSTHGGFSDPRRAAEKVFPPLDYTRQPPVQELIARDLHDNEWKFRHIFRGQPKRHLLTTGWSVFVSAKRLVAGDSVLFIWASPSEFVIPLAKYVKAVYHTRVSAGMRFRMLFETEESSVRRYMGTITGISDLDPVRWPNSHWRSVTVGWDESTARERQPRVSLWEIEPLTSFPMYPSPFPLQLKRPWSSALPSFHAFKDGDIGINSQLTLLQGGVGDQGIQSVNFQGFGAAPWIQPRVGTSSIPGVQPDVYHAMTTAALQATRTVDSSRIGSHSLLQFQRNQSTSTGSPSLIQRQISCSAPICTMISNKKQQQQQSQLTQQLPPVPQQISNVIVASPSASASHVQSSSLPAVASQCQQQTFSDPLGNSIATSDVSSMQSILAIEPQVSSGASNCLLSQVEQLETPQSNVSELQNLLPPFPGREYSAYHSATDPQNNLLFGVSIDSSSLMLQHGMTNLKNSQNENDALSLPYAASNFTSASGADFPLNLDMTTSSCVHKSGYLQSSGNVNQVNPPTGTFVKVHKSGFFGRSLDISKFGSYDELRCELAQMFGLEGQLEDPQRSGWQLVFVDRENDILLLGDDPWQEFVNSVWYIKIPSPLEVQQMGKEGQKPTISVPSQRPAMATATTARTT
ncbi:Auxin response factor 6 [Hibiscus syriacus]|uniref:Auxin response factor 6 n=1 Tax=Hibiscus syriacus TaxID=106335 RepID=A0A6A3D1B9_HIBSY|nr:Auxin response factor 6 [Hibiscus syriacus]